MDLVAAVVRTTLGGTLFGWLVRHMSFLIPGERLLETESLIAFHHPSPSYPTHILIVPRKRYRSLMQLDVEDPTLMQDVFRSVQALIRDMGLEETGYRFIVNGGSAQDVDHLHFHLVSGDQSDRIEKSRRADDFYSFPHEGDTT